MYALTNTKSSFWAQKGQVTLSIDCKASQLTEKSVCVEFYVIQGYTRTPKSYTNVLELYTNCTNLVPGEIITHTVVTTESI